MRFAYAGLHLNVRAICLNRDRSRPRVNTTPILVCPSEVVRKVTGIHRQVKLQPAGRGRGRSMAHDQQEV
jgi:hypothetical protein